MFLLSHVCSDRLFVLQFIYMRDLTPVCLNTLIYLSGEGFLLSPPSFNVTQIN